MFSKQAGVSNLADLFSPENLKTVSAKDIAQAKEDVSESGYWGVEQTSQRLFDFVGALAGDDVDKMKGILQTSCLKTIMLQRRISRLKLNFKYEIIIEKLYKGCENFRCQEDEQQKSVMLWIAIRWLIFCFLSIDKSVY